jgi:hypothetical protein
MRFATVTLLLLVASTTFAAYPGYGGYNYNGYGGYNGDANTDAILMDNIKSKNSYSKQWNLTLVCSFNFYTRTDDHRT